MNTRTNMTDKAPAKKTTQTYPCPQCKTLTRWDNNAWRPFCSERCKLIDLGDWATERHAIPGEDDAPGDFEEF